MSKTSRNIITVAVVILFLGAIVLYSVLSAHKVRVPAGELGNTAGNLNNNGLFCEKDGYVYFSNSYDDGCLYRMKPDQSSIEKIHNMRTKFINAGGGYVFFFGESNQTTTGLGSVVSKPGMYMVKSDGTKAKSLSREVSQHMLLVGNDIYYQRYNVPEGVTFASVNLTNYKKTEHLDFYINPNCYMNGLFYFNGVYDNHYLYTYNPATGVVNTVWEGDCWCPVYDGHYVYYLDILNNYRLCRYSIASNTIEVLTNERLDSYNLYNDIIYYQVADFTNPVLKRMNSDGSGAIVIAEGVYNSVNVTSTYTYFYEFGNDRTIYYTPTYGAPNVNEFNAAKQAVYSALKK